MKLNLGCSDDHKQGYINVDCVAPADEVVNLQMPWPWPKSSISEILAFDVFEHLYQSPLIRTSRDVGPKIWAMNEAHRVLAPNGILHMKVPCCMLSDGRVNPGAFADPTHVSYWTVDDKYYFCSEWNNPQGERGRLGPAYGITALFNIDMWRLVEYGAGHERRSKIEAVLRAVK